MATYGRLLSYGNASGAPANIPSADFTAANRTVIGFSMGRSPVGKLDHKTAMAEIFPMISSGKARLVVDQVMPMSQVADAHRHLANRGTRGKVILTPERLSWSLLLRGPAKMRGLSSFTPASMPVANGASENENTSEAFSEGS